MSDETHDNQEWHDNQECFEDLNSPETIACMDEPQAAEELF